MSATTDTMFATQRLRPVAALRAAIRLIFDNQDTAQVARLEVALAGRSEARMFARFAASPVGARVIAERRDLARTLDDHAYLATLPENSLGRHYLAFMEAEKLSAQGLVDATPELTAHLARRPEAYRTYVEYSRRAAHDIYHILGGYGRDELGEICVLAMSYEYLKVRSYWMISSVGRFVVAGHLRRRSAGGGVFAAVREASRIGRQAAWPAALDVEAALPEDLDTLRRRLRIGTPVVYHALIQRVRAQTVWRGGPFAVHSPAVPAARRI